MRHLQQVEKNNVPPDLDRLIFRGDLNIAVLDAIHNHVLVVEMAGVPVEWLPSFEGFSIESNGAKNVVLELYDGSFD